MTPALPAPVAAPRVTRDARDARQDARRDARPRCVNTHPVVLRRLLRPADRPSGFEATPRPPGRVRRSLAAHAGGRSARLFTLPRRVGEDLRTLRAPSKTPGTWSIVSAVNESVRGEDMAGRHARPGRFGPVSAVIAHPYWSGSVVAAGVVAALVVVPLATTDQSPVPAPSPAAGGDTGSRACSISSGRRRSGGFPSRRHPARARVPGGVARGVGSDRDGRRELRRHPSVAGCRIARGQRIERGADRRPRGSDRGDPGAGCGRFPRFRSHSSPLGHSDEAGGRGGCPRGSGRSRPCARARP